MRRGTYITTSWDDGHPYDLRVAELLAKYGLSGTFYVPMSAPHGTMNRAEMRELGGGFEIGAHTLNHVALTRVADRQAWQEIAGGKAWIEEVIGVRCLMFCPPEGKFFRRHAKLVRDAGYIGLRSVELNSLDYPRLISGMQLMPTSVQAYPHTPLVFGKNAAKRLAFGSLWRYLRYGHSRDWLRLVSSFLDRAIKVGGVFHLWGHSWELEEARQWRRLDEALRMLGQVKREAIISANGQICRQALRPGHPDGRPSAEPAGGGRSGQTSIPN